MVDALLDEASTELARRVEVKLAAARADFAKRFGPVPENLRQPLLEAMVPALPHFDSAHARCPVCDSLGVAEGEIDVDWDVSFGKDGEPDAGAARVLMRAESFVCSACGLKLVDTAEMAAAGMEASWTVVGVDAENYLDWYRDQYYDRYDDMI